jgi:sugar/nucleoside kinase (ribokinase family)
VTGSFAVFGNLSIDDLVFADGSTQWAVPGGNAMYSGLGMAVWVDKVSVVAPIGPDYPVRALRDRVDLSRCPQIPQTLRSWGLYEEDDSRHFIFRKATRNWEDFCPKPGVGRSGHQTAAHVAPMPRDIALGLIGELREAGTSTISVDLDERDLVNASLERVSELVRSVDLFLPSRQEALAIFPDADPVEALHRLRELAPDVALIAIKCGAEGVVAHVAGSREWIEVPAVPINLVDATGGGDSFCGGVLVGFIQAEQAADGLLYGIVSASFCVAGLGPSGLVAATKEEAHARVAVLRKRVTFHPM